jgi:hypothetical protein
MMTAPSVEPPAPPPVTPFPDKSFDQICNPSRYHKYEEEYPEADLARMRGKPRSTTR